MLVKNKPFYINQHVLDKKGQFQKHDYPVSGGFGLYGTLGELPTLLWQQTILPTLKWHYTLGSYLTVTV